MQPNKNYRSRHVQSTSPSNANSRFAREDNRLSIIILSVLCLLVPPVGVILLWRAGRLPLPVRLGLSALGFASMTLIFALLMRPADVVSTIRPTPQTPSLVGYGAASSSQYAYELPTEVPAQPDVYPGAGEPTADPAAVQDPGDLTDESIVYAVTNNASSYHLSQICDMQENNRSLTLQEALAEGLAPCEKCVGAVG